MGETKKKKRPQFVGFPPLKPDQRAKLEKDFKLGESIHSLFLDIVNQKVFYFGRVTPPIFSCDALMVHLGFLTFYKNTLFACKNVYKATRHKQIHVTLKFNTEVF